MAGSADLTWLWGVLGAAGVGVLATILRFVRRWWRRPKLSIFGAAAKTTPTDLPYVKVLVTPVIGNEGREPARLWCFEVDSPVSETIRIGFPGKGFKKYGDRYVVRWEAEGQHDAIVDRRELAPFEVEIPPAGKLVGRYRVSAPGAKGAEGEFRVEGDSGMIHFHPKKLKAGPRAGGFR